MISPWSSTRLTLICLLGLTLTTTLLRTVNSWIIRHPREVYPQQQRHQRTTSTNSGEISEHQHQQFQSQHYSRRQDRTLLKVSFSSDEINLETTENDDNDILLPQAFIDELQSLKASKDVASRNTDARRVFHGRGGYYGMECDHLTLDYYPPVWLLTSFDVDVSNRALYQIQEILTDFNGMDDDTSNGVDESNDNTSNDGAKDDNDKASSLNFVYQYRGKDSEGRNSCNTTLVCGSVPKPHIVTEENGVFQYYVTILQNQNHGIFLDMSNGRKWLYQHATHGDGKILNLFAYTCGFSVAAYHGNATEIINIDMSKGALKLGQQNHELNTKCSSNDEVNDDDDVGDDDVNGNQKPEQQQQQSRVRFLAHDIFKSWGKIQKLGPYDIVVVDPPSYQKGSFVAAKDYGKLIRRLPKLVRAPVPTPMTSGGKGDHNDVNGEGDNDKNSHTSGGYVMLCLNAPELTTSFLHDLMEEHVPDEFTFIERISNPVTFPAIDDERALKILIYQRK